MVENLFAVLTGETVHFLELNEAAQRGVVVDWVSFAYGYVFTHLAWDYFLVLPQFALLYFFYSHLLSFLE